MREQWKKAIAWDFIEMVVYLASVIFFIGVKNGFIGLNGAKRVAVVEPFHWIDVHLACTRTFIS